jgi:hypothetical protein
MRERHSADAYTTSRAGTPNSCNLGAFRRFHRFVRKEALSQPRAKELLRTTLQACGSPLNFLCPCREPNCRLFLSLLPAFAL